MKKESKEEVIRILEASRKLIENKDDWIKGTDAIDGRGRAVSAISKIACKFCMRGAIIHSCRTILEPGDDLVKNMDEVLDRLTERSIKRMQASSACMYLLGDISGELFGNGCVYDFNDQATHEQVMKVFDVAIEKMKNEKEEEAKAL